MIFVILGTQDKPFYRLIKKIDELVQNGDIKEQVVVQAGSTKYKTDNMKIIQYMDMKEFQENIKNSNLIITHAGVGSILSALKESKKVIAIARLKKYKEHVNNHQLQILDNFSNEGYILKLENEEELLKKIQEAKRFNPKKYKSNKEFFLKKLQDRIESFNRKNNGEFYNIYISNLRKKI